MPEYESPMSGWLIVSVDGDRVTKVAVDAGETIEVEVDDDE